MTCGIVLTKTYDRDNTMTQRKDSLGGTMNRVYNDDHLVTSEQFSGTGLTPLRADFGYMSLNDVSGVMRYNNLTGTARVGTTSYTFDKRDRLTAINNYNSTGVTVVRWRGDHEQARKSVVPLGGAVTVNECRRGSCRQRET